MPEIDHLLITHDHWDHLDYPSVTALEPKVRKVIAGLGVGAYFEQWGYAQEKIHEADWFAVLELERGFTIRVLPARHYSRRLLTRNKTLWTGYALETAKRRIFFSGDSGYGPHFPELGRTFDGFDLAVLDMGQYDDRWPYLHMTPEEAAQAAEALRAKALLPAHVGRFSIARHSWDEPFKRIAAASEGKKYRLLTPMIGEPVSLDDGNQRFSRWWESVE
jgi:L-ascorbate metabolism protein UlaG (beta-lactamase superfamily)